MCTRFLHSTSLRMGSGEQLASATGLEGKGEKEACHNLFSHARTFPEFWEFCIYVNEFTVYFTIIISNISTWSKTGCGRPPFLSSRPAEEASEQLATGAHSRSVYVYSHPLYMCAWCGLLVPSVCFFGEGGGSQLRKN